MLSASIGDNRHVFKKRKFFILSRYSYRIFHCNVLVVLKFRYKYKIGGHGVRFSHVTTTVNFNFKLAFTKSIAYKLSRDFSFSSFLGA